MDDRTLYYFCLIFSAVGIVSLMVFSSMTSPEKVEVSSIGEDDIGSEVEVRGYIESVYKSEDGDIFFHVKEGKSVIDIALFSEDVKEMGIQENMIHEDKEVIIEGEVGMYRGELQILPDKIVL